MRLIILLFFVPLQLLSQSEIDIITPVRWTRIDLKLLKNDHFNAPNGIVDDSAKYLYTCMQMLANSDTMFYFLEGGDISDKQKLYFESALALKIDSSLANNQWTYLETSIEKNFLISTAPDWNPFFLENGFPYIRINPDGWEEFCYPPRTYFQIIPSEVTEFRVREEGMYDQKKKKIEYTPVAIEVFPVSGYNGSGHLYFDLKRVKDRFNDPKRTPWLVDIIQAIPQGEQYMQTKVRTITH
jgi:hypothetical protein